MKRVFLLAVLLAAPGLVSAETEIVTFALMMNSTNVPSVIGDRSTGGGDISIRIDRDAGGTATKAYVTFRLNWRFDGEQSVTAAHIHRGDAGMGGPVVIGTALMGPLMTDPRGGGTFTSMVEMEFDDLSVIEEILVNPGGFYMNVHTAAHRGGHIRSQLLPPATSLISDLIDDNAALEAKVDGLQEELDAGNDLLERVARRLGLVP